MRLHEAEEDAMFSQIAAAARAAHAESTRLENEYQGAPRGVFLDHIRRPLTMDLTQT